MKIISRYKDYYDHLTHQYGVDPLLVYKRLDSLNFDEYTCIQYPIHCKDEYYAYVQIIGSDYSEFSNCRFESNHFAYDSVISHSNFDYNKKTNIIYYEQHVLVVCSVPYLVCNYKIKDSSHDHYRKTLASGIFVHSKLESYTVNRYFTSVNLKLNAVADLVKDVGKPVFLISNVPRAKKNIVNVVKGVPNLGEIGFGKFQTPEQVYQNISQYISTEIPTKELIEPDNLVKILKHGFDSRKSFRK